MKDQSPRNKMDELKWILVGLFGKWMVDGLCLGTRIDSIGLEKIRPLLDSRKFILAFWHSRILFITYIFKGLNAIALVSKSDDGEIIARVLHRQGQISVRGSTGKGGRRALVRQIRLMKTTGNPGAVIPDGPQGPRFKVQPGVITLAQETGFPIIPVTYSVRRAKVLNSWDRFMMPLPFTRCRVIYGDPIHVRADADRADRERYQRLLETDLCRITTEADSFFGRHPD